MAPHPPSATASFSTTLPFRPQGKRKRAGSLPRNFKHATPTHQATVEEDVDEYFAQNSKLDEDPHATKRRRFNNPGDEEPVDESHAAASSSVPDAPDIDSAFDDLKLRSRTVRRRRAPVSPFIPSKPRGITKAVRKPKPRVKPVFGIASLITAEEEQLVNALKKQGAQVIVMKNLNGLPEVALDPTIGQAEKSKGELDNAQVPVTFDAKALKHNDEGILVPSKDDEQVPVSSGNQGQMYYDQQAPEHPEEEGSENGDRACVCQSVTDNTDTLAQCEGCEKVYHPQCIGKGRQGYGSYQDNRREALLEDVKFFRKHGGFTCTDCDSKALAKKKNWASKELDAEKKRRSKLFKRKLNKGETEPRICDNVNCNEEIIGLHYYSCQFCENYDLCPQCHFDPAVSSLHQHSAADMKMK
ncbi:hypothetical protein MBLNU13_g08227t1 [Cladosporium sp. NU13]